MARKPKTQVVAEATAERVSVDNGIVSMGQVKSFPISSRRLITVGADHPIWGEGHPIVMSMTDALVRLEPPQGTTDAALDAVEKLIADAGAAAIRVGHRQRQDAVLAPPTEAAPKVVSLHQVVMQLVDESLVGDKEALRSVIEEAIAAEGL